MTDIEILESTYFDRCIIKRKEKIKNPNTGVTETEEVIIAEDVKCALSTHNSDNTMLVDGVGKAHLTSSAIIISLVSVTPVLGFFIFSFLLIIHLSK